MKRALVAFIVVIILGFLAILIAPSLVDLNRYKDKAVIEVEEKTGLKLDLKGDIDFSLLPTPRFTVSDVSVASPEGSKGDNLLSFKQLSVNIDLILLFSGRVSVNSITLVKPVISLEMFKNNSLNILTKKLKNISNEDSKTSSKSSFTPDISMDKIRIKDGTFSYFDHKSASNIIIQNINADLSAKSLTGPFLAQGSMFYDGHAINFDLTSDAYDTENKILSPKITLTLQPADIKIKYAGVINMGDEFSMQGQTTMHIENLQGILPDYKQDKSLDIKGFLSANTKTLDYKDFEMILGDDRFNGSLHANMSPFNYSLSLKNTKPLDLKELLQKDLPFAKGSFDLAISGDDKKIILKKSTFKLDDNIIKISGKITDLQKSPIVTANIFAMNGEVIINTMVKDSFVFDDISLRLKHKNMAKAIQILTGAKIQDANLKKPLNLYTKISQSGNKYYLKEIKGNLSGVSVMGQLDIDLSHKKPKVSGDLKFGNIKLASAMVQNKGGNKSTTRWSKDQIDTSMLHFVNADISLYAQKINYGAWPLIKPSLKLNLTDGVLKINDLNSGLFGGKIHLNSTIQSVSKPRQPVYFESKMSIDNADLGSLSKAMLGTQLVKISGKSSLNMDIKTSGASPAALINDLGGNASIKGSDIILDGVDISRFARSLSEENKISDTVLGIWKGASKGGKSEFDTLDGAFIINQGVVQVNKMDLDGSQSSIETRGNINLPNWTLATKHKITVKGDSDIPPFEITFKGSLDNPSQTFGKGLLEDYINRKVQRKFNDLISKKLGGSSSNDNEKPSEPTQSDDIEDTIKGVLGDLLR